MEERLEPLSDQIRELSRAVALGDFQGANIILDLMARDEFICLHELALGRSDAAAIRRRDAKPAILKAA